MLNSDAKILQDAANGLISCSRYNASHRLCTDLCGTVSHRSDAYFALESYTPNQ